MKCPECKIENPDSNLFCRECGTKFSRPCPGCGADIFPQDKFCGKCGHKIAETKEASRIDYSNPQSYTPKFLADKILTTRSSMEGERKLVTVLFADVAGYTSLSEKLDPEEVHQIMDGCFKILLEEIHRYEGTINQFTGDGVMALFGAPLAHEDHAQRACHAALSIQHSLSDYSEGVKKECGQEFRMRIGLNSGPVVVGSIGDDLRMDYTAVGDTTNLASRMQSLAKPGAVYLTQNTHRLAKDFFEFEPLGKLSVKGKEEPQECYRLVKVSEVKTRIEAAVASGLTKFVGREKEMHLLRPIIEKAKSGAGQVVGIVGEAGVGKSRLILELRKVFIEQNYRYLEGRCLHYGSSMAYLPVLDILRSYFEVNEGEKEYSIRKKMSQKILALDEKLKTALPAFQELLSLKAEDEAYQKLEPKQKRERIFESLRDLFIRESQEKPLVLVFEDLHWIDRSSEDFLDYLIGWLANTRILLIILYRPEYTHRWANKSYYTNIGVDQLTIPASAELVQSILGEGEIVPELRELILNKAAGNPLFMEELTHTLIENGTIRKEENRYLLSKALKEMRVPDTIQGIIAARMDRLEESLKRIMQVASVIGREFAFRILQAIVEMKENLKSQLLNLQGLEFIYEKRLFPELEYIFKHALTQEVAYNSLLLKRRKEIHEKIGLAIEGLYPDRLEEFYEMLAYHYSRSDNLEKACHYLKLSGNKATKNHSLREAFRFYKETINVLKQMPQMEENRREQLEVILLMAIPMRLLGYPEDSFEFLQEGEKLCKDLGDIKSVAALYTFMSLFHSAKGNPELGRKYLEESFAEAEKIQDIEIMAPVGYGLCFSYQVEGEHGKVVNIAPKVIALLEKTQREDDFFGAPYNIYSAIHAQYGSSKGALGEFPEGEQICEKALSFANKTRHLNTMGVAEFGYGNLSLFKGDGESAVRHMQNCIGYFEKSQAAYLLPSAWSGLGCGYYLLGNLNTALKFMEKSLKMRLDTGLALLSSMHHVFLSYVHFDLGNLSEAKFHTEQARKLAETNHEKYFEGMSWVQLGRIIGKMEESQFPKSEDYILKGLKILEELKAKPNFFIGQLSLGELYSNTGRREKAVEALKGAEAEFQEMGMEFFLGRARKVLASIGA